MPGSPVGAPVTRDFAVFFVGVTIGQTLASGAKIDIFVRLVDEILLAETPLGLGA